MLIEQRIQTSEHHSVVEGLMQATAASVSRNPLTRQKLLRASALTAPVGLLALGAISLGIYYWARDLHRFTQWIAAYEALFIGQLFLYLLACFIVERFADSRNLTRLTVCLVFVFAFADHAVLVAQRPYLSSDVYRYVWDGRVQSAGINPYWYVPEANELSGLRDEAIYTNINREDKQWTSPYPPVAQMVFLAVAELGSKSVTVFKSAMSLFDLLTILLLMLVLARSGINPARAIIFAWNPLVIIEGAHSGHIESIYVAFLALAFFAWSNHKHSLTGVSLALATLVKFYPALLLPAFLVVKPNNSDGLNDSDDRSLSSGISKLINRANASMLIAFVVTVIVAYLPYMSAGEKLFAFVRGYVQEEGFVQTGARYFFLDAARTVAAIPTLVFISFATVLFGWLALRQASRVKRDAVDLGAAALCLIGTYLLLTTPRYAWYYIWVLPFLCLAPRLGWLYLASASALLYLVWYTPLVYPEVPLWLGAAIYVPTLILLVWDYARSRRMQLDMRQIDS